MSSVGESPGSMRFRLTEVLPWCGWGLLTLAALAYVWRYGVNCPIWDEWGMVPALTGEEPLLPWLWVLHNEHRLPLPRLIFYALTRGSGYDFRAGMVFNVLVLAALSLVLMLAARRLRGRSSPADAFFPLLLLHWGHHENFLMGYQVAFVCPVALVGIVLAVIVTRGRRLTPAAAGAAGLSLVLLPLCGAAGMAFLPALALWAPGTALVGWRQAEAAERRARALLLILTGIALLLGGFYLAGYHRPPGIPLPSNPGNILRTSLQCLAISPGPGVLPFWRGTALVVVCLVVWGSGVLLLAVFRNGQYRAIAPGLGCILAAGVTLVLAVGWGRASPNPHAGLAPRYALLASPLLCGIFFAGETCRRAVSRRVGRTTLCLLMVLCLGLNARHGLKAGYCRRNGLRQFERALCGGIPVSVLVERYGSFLLPAHPNPHVLTPLLHRLRETRTDRIGE